MRSFMVPSRQARGPSCGRSPALQPAARGDAAAAAEAAPSSASAPAKSGFRGQLPRSKEGRKPSDKRQFRRQHRASLSVDDCDANMLGFKRTPLSDDFLDPPAEKSGRGEKGDKGEKGEKGVRSGGAVGADALPAAAAAASAPRQPASPAAHASQSASPAAPPSAPPPPSAPRPSTPDSPRDPGSPRSGGGTPRGVSFRTPPNHRSTGTSGDPCDGWSGSAEDLRAALLGPGQLRSMTTDSDADAADSDYLRRRESGVVHSWGKELRRVSRDLPELFRGFSSDDRSSYHSSFLKSVGSAFRLAKFRPLIAVCGPLPLFVALVALSLSGGAHPEALSAAAGVSREASLLGQNALGQVETVEPVLYAPTDLPGSGQSQNLESDHISEGTLSTPALPAELLPYAAAVKLARGPPAAAPAAVLDGAVATRVFAVSYAFAGVLALPGVFLPAGMDLKGIDVVVSEEQLHVVWKLLIRSLFCQFWYFLVLEGTILAMGRWGDFLSSVLTLLTGHSDPGVLYVGRCVVYATVVAFGFAGAFESLNRFFCYHSYHFPQIIIYSFFAALECIAYIIGRAAYGAGPLFFAAVPVLIWAVRAVALAFFCIAYKYELGWQSGVRVKLYHRRRVVARGSLGGLAGGPPSADAFRRRAQRVGTGRPSAAAVRQKLFGLDEPLLPQSSDRLDGSSSLDRKLDNGSNRLDSRGDSSVLPRAALGEESSLSKQAPDDWRKRLSSGSICRRETAESVCSPPPQSAPAPPLPPPALASPPQQPQPSPQLPSLLSARRSSRRLARSPCVSVESVRADAAAPPPAPPAPAPAATANRRAVRGRTLVSVRSVPLDNSVVLEALCLPKSSDVRAYVTRDFGVEFRGLLSFLRVALPSAAILAQEWASFLLLLCAGSGAGGAADGAAAAVAVGLAGAAALAAPTQAVAAAAVEKSAFLLSIGHTQGAKYVLQSTVRAAAAYVAGMLALAGLLAGPALLRRSAAREAGAALALFFVVDCSATLGSTALRGVGYFRGSLALVTVAWLLPLTLIAFAAGLGLRPASGAPAAPYAVLLLQSVCLLVAAGVAYGVVWAKIRNSCNDPLSGSDGSYCLTYLSVPCWRRGPPDCRALFAATRPGTLRVGSARLEEVMLRMSHRPEPAAEPDSEDEAEPPAARRGPRLSRARDRQNAYA